MRDEVVRDRLHERLRGLRAAVVWKLEGLDAHDARRPLTATGTNLLGLVKHLSVSEALYLGDVFGRPFPDMPDGWWDDDLGLLPCMWARADESRDEVVDRYRRVWAHSDATIASHAIDAPGHVFWWPRPDVTLLDVMVHVVSETSRHAGHADIVREQIDGAIGTEADNTSLHRFDPAFWSEHRATVERAATEAAARAATRGRAGRPEMA